MINLIKYIFTKKKLAEDIPIVSGDIEEKNIVSDYLSSYYDLSQFNPYNPDPLVLTKTMSIYDDMYFSDEQIKASFNLIKLFVCNKGYDIVLDSVDDEKQKQIRDCIDFTFNEGYRGIFLENVKQILSGIQFGFSLSEIVLQVFKAGQYKGKIGLGELLTRPPHTIEFHLDPKGKIEQTIQHGYNGDIELNLEKFILYVYNSQFGNPYGLSAFMQCYRWFLLKDYLVKYSGISAERFSMPYVVGKVIPGMSQTQQNNLLTVLRRIQSKGAAVIPDNTEIEFLESKNMGNASYYKDMIALCNTAISRNFLLPELLGFTDHDTGSQALGKEQFEIFLNSAIYPEQRVIEDLIDENLIVPLVNMNFGHQDTYPKFKFRDLTDKDKTKLYELWISAVEKGVVKNTLEDENVLRNNLDFPERTEDEETETPVPEAPVEEVKKVAPELKEKFYKRPTAIEIESLNLVQKVLEGFNFQEEIQVKEIKFTRKPTEFEEQLSLVEIKDTIGDEETALTIPFSEVMMKIKVDLENKINKSKIVETKDFKAINELTVTKKLLKDLQKVFNESLSSIFQESFKIAQTDLNKQKKELSEKKELQNIQYIIGALEPKEAIEYLKNSAFMMTGVEDEFVLKGTKQLLESGLRFGKTNSEIMADIENFFLVYQVKVNKLGEIIATGGRIQTIVRTSLNDAFNQGRLAVYNEEGSKEIIEALQYSAILDDRTTDFCLSYDTKIYNASDSIWDWLTPPNHFNCRSFLTPVIVGEEYDVSNKIAARPPVAFGGNV